MLDDGGSDEDNGTGTLLEGDELVQPLMDINKGTISGRSSVASGKSSKRKAKTDVTMTTLESTLSTKQYQIQ